MLDALPPYNGEACVMCGGVQGRLEFCDVSHITGSQAAGARRKLITTTEYGGLPFPHLHVLCADCGYEWLMRVRSA